MIFDQYNQYFNGGHVTGGGFIYLPALVDYTYLNVGTITIEKYLSAGEIDLDTYIDAGDYALAPYIDTGEYTL